MQNQVAKESELDCKQIVFFRGSLLTASKAIISQLFLGLTYMTWLNLNSKGLFFFQYINLWRGINDTFFTVATFKIVALKKVE